VGSTVIDTQDGTDSIRNVDEIRGTSIADFMTAANTDLDVIFRGNGGNDTLIGGDGSNFLSGGSGDDSLNPGDNSLFDEIAAGTGLDVVDLAELQNGYVDFSHFDTPGRITVDVDASGPGGTGGTAVISKSFGADEDGAGTTTINDIKQAILNGNGTSTIGGAGFIGTDFDDIFNILGADDVTAGKDGYIALNGGDGADTYNILGGDSFIRLDFRNTAATEGVIVNLWASTISNDGFGNGTAEGEVLVGGNLVSEVYGADIGGDNITGNSDANVLHGLAGNDTLNGGVGKDTLFGGNGLDTLIGGDGDDEISGGEDSLDLRDVVFAGAGNDNIDGGYGNDELRGDAGNDTIEGGFGSDTVIGGTGDDVLSGSALSDEIFGSDGFDFINGGFGFDRLNGGADGDRFFHLGIADHGSDWIQDYNAAEGDVLMYGGGVGAATVDDFLLQTANTANAGADGVDEVFVTHIPSGNLLWALVDGDGQSSINIRIGQDVFDLLA